MCNLGEVVRVYECKPRPAEKPLVNEPVPVEHTPQPQPVPAGR